MSEKRRGEVRKKIWKNTEETGFRFSPDGILHCEEPAVSFFEENPKNLLAALKIAAKSGAVLREDVERAVFQCFHNIVRLSGKDVLDELSPLICGACADSILDRYRDVFACVIPELAPMFDLDQHSPYHNRDVWHHTLAGVADIPPVFELRMTMLLHDIAKPTTAEAVLWGTLKRVRRWHIGFSAAWRYRKIKSKKLFVWSGIMM